MQHVEVRGERIPALGFGTWQLSGDAAHEGVRHALELGYRHIDTAQMYANEEEVGRAVRDSGVDRDEVFLTTKVPPRNLEPGVLERSHEGSLRALSMDRVDLLLIHWPSDRIPLGATLDAMRSLQEQGKTRHIGVSNFTPSLVREALRHAEVICNQVEYHPFLGQRALCELAVEQDLMLAAYSPLAKGRVAKDATLREIGAAHDKTPAQVALRWLVQQRNVAALPRSSSPTHRAENLDVFDFHLSDDEVKRIEELDRDQRLIDPGLAPDWER
ncbi:MAG TPA: aldo/keto reductase [Nitriliruptorales bacterium]|nr:aldo/keto reductase [Nitriliruptorales bacterium]